MKYLGGKHGIGKRLAAFMAARCPPGEYKAYLEPFCGSLGVFKHMTDKGYKEYIAADAHPDLIAMWKSVKAKKLNLPRDMTEKEYQRLKKAKSPNPMKAVAGFGLSFGGKYFAGYAQKAAGDSGRNFFQEFKRSLAKIAPRIQRRNVKFQHSTYSALNPKNMLIYCDPPYRNTEGYSVGGFDHDKFWDTMRRWSKDNCVFISEESAPRDFKVVWRQIKRRTLDHSTRFHRVEKVYMYRPGKLVRGRTARNRKNKANNRRTRRR